MVVTTFERSFMRRALVVGLLVLAGCGGGGSGATCPTNSTLTYSNFGQTFFARYCDRCHSGRTSPALGSLSAIRANSTAIDAQAAAGPSATNTSMPQGSPQPTDAERRQLGEWLACGAP